ncbi:TonB-dependent receptor [Achromobacter xylosoxidans]|uniref:TonB-dependent siderophore receptor n=1 Tax=Alcaligenes xylosoxydans xylosoxydans TaxID=85698 RepID=A0A424WBC9_ALCXX|nr:TonB-dependent siderophore receptor [Achromobacter xylosoxidans]MBC9902760.1 TonB-dependent siderophore receptor [Achromobacter xylosoxidans]MBD0868265.1 TonB-dependent siderophore receptor [Achromobacter xylosoxidans]QNP83189.1 TonB-dependent siderophore receptor [Achromobacter xylosoxidans]RPJ90649.1 TonB-dependent siderophore receptor [Achromobacter xylosoxidans]
MHQSGICRPFLGRSALGLALSGGMAMALAAVPAVNQAQTAPEQLHAIDVPAQSLNTALTMLSRQTGTPIMAGGAHIAAQQAPAVAGRMTVREALSRLLLGSGLSAASTPGGGYAVTGAAQTPAVTTLAPVQVMGSSQLPEPYAGGQVARGGRVGLLGERDAMDTPFNIASYTAELIQNQQANSIADVLANDASVRTVNDGQGSVAGTGDEFQIRGFPVRNQDVSFNGLYGMLPLRTIALDGVERVEVLKGPTALLNGMSPRGSVGGGINVVPKRAGDDPLTRLTTTYQSDSRFGGMVDIGRRFGENQEFGFRFNGSYRDGDTAVQNQSNQLGVAVVGLDYRGERLRVSLDAGHQTNNIDAPGDSGVLIFGDSLPVPRPPDASKGYSPDWGYAKSRDNYGVLHAEYDLAPHLTVFGGVGYRRSNNRYLYADPIVVGSTGELLMRPYYWPSYEQNVSTVWGARGNFSTGPVKHEASLSYSTFEQRAGYYDYYIFGLSPSNLYDPADIPKPSIDGLSSSPPRTSLLKLPTVALADTLSFADDRVQFTAGLRYQTVKATNYSYTTGRETSSYDESAVTPAFGLVVKPWTDVSLYANYIEGLTAGPIAPAGASNAGEIFAPIKTKQIEAGVKVDFGTLTTTLGLFQIKQPSGLTTVDNGVTRYDMSGEQRNRGVEFNAYGELARGVRLLGGVTYIQPTMIRTAKPQTDGNSAVGVPRWMANIGMEWDPSFAPGLTLSARALSTSWQYQNLENSRRIPGWTRWDLGMRYATRAFDHPVTLRATVNNVFGKDYWSSASEGYLRLGSPRSVLLSASIDF